MSNTRIPWDSKRALREPISWIYSRSKIFGRYKNRDRCPMLVRVEQERNHNMDNDGVRDQFRVSLSFSRGSFYRSFDLTTHWESSEERAIEVFHDTASDSLSAWLYQEVLDGIETTQASPPVEGSGAWFGWTCRPWIPGGEDVPDQSVPSPRKGIDRNKQVAG